MTNTARTSIIKHEIAQGERYYAGGTVSKTADRTIILDPDWGTPESRTDEPLNSIAVAFLSLPPRTGGVTGFLT